MKTEKKLQSRFGRTKDARAFEPFGADVTLQISLDAEAADTRIVSFIEEVNRLRGHTDPLPTEEPAQKRPRKTSRHKSKAQKVNKCFKGSRR